MDNGKHNTCTFHEAFYINLVTTRLSLNNRCASPLSC